MFKETVSFRQLALIELQEDKKMLISDGSWLVLRMTENATLALPDRTEMPRAVPVGSEVGLESQTTRHLPSRMMGSVSF